jgi:hypothetical protein
LELAEKQMREMKKLKKNKVVLEDENKIIKNNVKILKDQLASK